MVKQSNIRRRKRRFVGNRFTNSKAVSENESVVVSTANHQDQETRLDRQALSLGETVSDEFTSTVIEEPSNPSTGGIVPSCVKTTQTLLPAVAAAAVTAPAVATDTNTIINTSRSFEKLSENMEMGHPPTPDHDNLVSGNIIMDMEILSNIFSILGCPECHDTTLSTAELNKQGFAKRYNI